MDIAISPHPGPNIPEYKLKISKEMDSFEKILAESSYERNEEILSQRALLLFKIPFTILIAYWSFILLTTAQLTWVPTDYANFLIHESGHIIFRIFYLIPLLPSSIALFLVVLGGTFTQVALPIIIFIYFLRQKALYSALFCLYWLGDNLILVKFYIADARCQCLPLLSLDAGGGPVIHDWHYMLNTLHLLPYDTSIAFVVYCIGFICLLAAVTFMCFLIIKDMFQKTVEDIQMV